MSNSQDSKPYRAHLLRVQWRCYYTSETEMLMVFPAIELLTQKKIKVGSTNLGAP